MSMNVKSKSKLKMISSLITCALSFFSLVTLTLSWFAMNKDTDAGGMGVHHLVGQARNRVLLVQ